MQIVIDIPDNTYTAIMEKYNTFPTEMKKWCLDAIKNGTPLSKGHGELVYREDVCNELRYMDNNGFITRSVNHVIEDIKKGVPTIIEADKAESEV